MTMGLHPGEAPVSTSNFTYPKFSILPFGPDAPELTVRLGWHERTHADPACQLIRSVLIEAVRKKAAALL